MDPKKIKKLTELARQIDTSNDKDIDKLLRLSKSYNKTLKRLRQSDPKAIQKTDDELILTASDEVEKDAGLSLEDGLKSYSRVFKNVSATSIVGSLPLLLSLRGQPYTLEDHFPMEPMFSRELPIRFLFRCGRQVSKCLAEGTQVTAFDGRSIKIEDFKRKSLPSLKRNFKFTSSPVVGLYNNGNRRVYKLTTSLGHELVATGNHQIRTLFGYTNILDLKEKLDAGNTPRVAVPRRVGRFTGQTKISDAEVEFIALMLGDGDTCKKPGFTSETSEVIEAFLNACSQLGAKDDVTVRYENDTLARILISQKSSLLDILDKRGLRFKKAWEKTIPQEIFGLNKKQTALFINRLWATDGNITVTNKQKSSIEIKLTSTSKCMLDDVQRLLSKFGILTRVRTESSGYTKNGKFYKCRNAYRLLVRTRKSALIFLQQIGALGKSHESHEAFQKLQTFDRADVLPATFTAELGRALGVSSQGYVCNSSNRIHVDNTKNISIKALERVLAVDEHVEKLTKTDLKFFTSLVNNDIYWDKVISVEYVGYQQTYDLEIDNTSNFIANNIVVHNSTTLAAQGVIQSSSTSYFKSLFVTPLFEQCRRFSSNYVRPFVLESQIKSAIVDRHCEQSVLQRSFRNKSIMYFSYCLKDADRIRGISADRVTIDECQDIDWDLLPVVLETMSASKWAVMQAAGTPKTLDNTIEYLWNQSSQAEWVTRCTACNYWNIAAMDHDLIRMIGKSTVVCAKCQRPINPRPALHPKADKRGTGQWLHTFKNRVSDFPGYHAPQVIFPMHYDNPRKWKILREKMDTNNTPRHIFINEVLGEGADVGTKLISQADLIKASKIYNRPNKIIEALKRKNDYLDVAIGVDWGGSTAPYGAGRAHLLLKPEEAQSYTVLSVVGLKPNGKLDVIYLFKFDLIGNHVDEAQACLSMWQDIDEGHGTTMFCHDYGGAGSVRETLVVQMGLPVQNIIGCAYMPQPQARIMELKQKGGRTYYATDKARSLIFLCQAIKVGFIGLPEWSTCHHLAEDFLALMEDTVERPGGFNITRVIRKPGIPDDASHAINYAALGLWYRHGYPNFKDVLSLEATIQKLQKSAAVIQEDDEAGINFGFEPDSIDV